MNNQWCRCLLLSLAIVTQAAGFAAAQKTIFAPKLRNQPDEWFKTDEAKLYIDNILAAQQPIGGWCKAYNVAATQPSTAPTLHGQPGDGDREWAVPTIDNGCTYSEMQILARAHQITSRSDVVEPINRGIDYLLKMQYANGGFPQRYPDDDNYGRYITLNDDAMTNVMYFLRDVSEGKSPFEFVDTDRRLKCKKSFDLGVDCLLKMQIKVNGELTAWCQQHDPETLAPAPARKFELIGITADESGGAVRLLMTIPNPSTDIRKSIHAVAHWYDRSKLLGIRTQTKPDPTMPHSHDVLVVQDATAKPLWARFYDIETNKPFFAGRDSVKHWSLAEIEPERRSGYTWYNAWGVAVFKDYAQWCKVNGETSVVKDLPPSTEPSK